jgi:hyperosmotically inducible periplasmic protein
VKKSRVTSPTTPTSIRIRITSTIVPIDTKGQREKAAEMDEAGKAVGEKVEKAGEYLDDAAITAKIKGEILNDPLLKVLQINVTTTHGIVTLSGVVDSKESIDRAVEIARRVKEVKSVENSLVVKGAG